MRCGDGFIPEDCVEEHWCKALCGERVGLHWRARCPVCQRPGNFEITVTGGGIRWNCHTKPRCDHDEIRALLGELLPCRRRKGYRPDSALVAEVGKLITTSMDPSEMRLLIGQAIWPGLPVTEVAERLGLSRATRYRLHCPPRVSR